MKNSRSIDPRLLQARSVRSPSSGAPPLREGSPSGVYEISAARGASAHGLHRRLAVKPRLYPLGESIFFARWPPLMTTSDLDEHLEEMVAVAHAAPSPVAFVIDMTVSGAPSAQVRHLAAEKLAVAYSKAGSRVACVSHVIVSPLIRGVVTAVHWLSPAPFPTHVAPSIHEAVSWARTILRPAHRSAGEKLER